ncbi:MAG: tetratricopeptide repeat protein [Bacteroidales bacterium]|nr:tetratricopeptide repeat protein [Bacteroidales bacterium]
MAKKKEVIDIQKEQAAAASKAEQFLSTYSKTIWTIVAAILVVAAVIFGYNKWIYAPKAAEAQAALYPCEEQFRAGNWEVALNGNENIAGFDAIISEYGNKAGAAVYFYAGVCNYNLKNYETALAQLKKYNGKDQILAGRAIACQGDCLVALEKYDEAIAAFKKAAKVSDNIYSAGYLKKAALVYEVLDNKAEALKCYKEIKDNYPASYEAYDVDKFISRIAE